MKYTPNDAVRNSDDFKTISAVMKKFEKIEEKNRCIRVKFLDWFSAKLSSWSVKTKEISNRIQSPCRIKL
jgi:hypothetical protein